MADEVRRAGAGGNDGGDGRDDRPGQPASARDLPEDSTSSMEALLAAISSQLGDETPLDPPDRLNAPPRAPQPDIALPPSPEPADSFDPDSSMEALLRSISDGIGTDTPPPPPPPPQPRPPSAAPQPPVGAVARQPQPQPQPQPKPEPAAVPQSPAAEPPEQGADAAGSMEDLLRSIAAQLDEGEAPPPPPGPAASLGARPVGRQDDADADADADTDPAGSMEDLLRSIAAQLDEGEAQPPSKDSGPTSATEAAAAAPMPPRPAQPRAAPPRPEAPRPEPQRPAARSSSQPSRPQNADGGAGAEAKDADAVGSMEDLLRSIASQLDEGEGAGESQGADNASGAVGKGSAPPAPPRSAEPRPLARTDADDNAAAPPPGDAGLLNAPSARDPEAGRGARDLLREERVPRPRRAVEPGSERRNGLDDRRYPPLDGDDDPDAVAAALREAERRVGLEDRRRGDPDPARIPPTGDRRAPVATADRRGDEGKAKGPSWEVKPSASTSDDPLLGCLTILCALLDRPLSSEALTAGLPLVDGRLSTELFPRAAERAGIAARLVSRSLGSITRIALPCVLLLKGRRACVLTELQPGLSARIVLPEMGAGAREVPWQELLDEYVGYAIFARPEFQFDSRSEDMRVADPKGWFWGTIMSSWQLYIEVAIAAFLINAFAIASPLFTMNVYDRVVPNFAEETLWVLATGVAIIYLFDFLLKFARTKLVDAAGKRADTRIAARLFQQVMGMKMGARPQSAGSLANTMREFDTLREFFTSSTMVTLIDLPFLFLFVGVIYLLGGPLAVIPLAAICITIPVVFLIQLRLQKVVQETFREAQQKHAILVEAISGVETIKSTASEGRMQRNWETFVNKTSMSAQKAHFWSQAAILFSGWMTQMVTVAIIVYGVYLIAEGLLSVGALVAVNLLAGRAMAPLGQVAGIIIRFNQSRVSLKALDEMMRTPVERPEGRKFITRSNFGGAVEFKNVGFTYPNAQTQALIDCSFKIQAGEKVGIIGRIGSGKSTLERLLLGLYEPTEGAVMVDGIDTRQLDPADLRRAVGVVPQDVYLFFGSVRENIALAAPYADDAAILRAARIAGVDEFVARHPQGFDLQVGERGMSLSGGQRQAISVARALLLDPPILLMDEPTSSMDNTTESRFKARLGTVLGGRTLILITHRGSLLSLVDRLIVMDGGKVVADGPKEDVLEALAGGRIHTAKD